MMIKSMALTVLSLCAAISTLCVACAGTPASTKSQEEAAPTSTPVQEKGLAFTEVQGKEWKLAEIRTGSGEIIFDRGGLISEGFGDNLFTLKFEDDRIGGMAAPNRYFAPYELGQGQDLAIKNIAGTLMAPIREPEKLKEHEYFAYLQNTYRWNIGKGNLELFTKGGDGREAVLVYTAE
jgi:heat shock protein HslJ